MANFEDALLERLKQHEPDPASALPPRRRLTPVASAVIAVVAALAAVLVPSLGDGAPTAQAVTLNPDGTVTISIDDLAQIDPANAELQRLGVTNIVLVAETEPGTCAPEDRPGPSIIVRGLQYSPPWNSRDIITINRALIPPDRTLLLIPNQRLSQPQDGLLAWVSVVVPTQARYCSDTLADPLPPAPVTDDGEGNLTATLPPTTPAG